MARLRLSSSALPPETRALGFEGREALSTPFAFDVWFVVEGEQPEPPDLIGQRATLHVEPLDLLQSLTAPHVFAGVFERVELLVELPGRALYRASLVPRLRLLELSLHSRIWTKRDIKDVLGEVLASYGLDVDLRVPAPPAEEHICQYKESDLAFFSRWLEREGWYYFFEHEDGKETLVVVADKSSHVAVRSAPIRYFPGSLADGSASEAFEDFVSASEAVPGGVTLADYDYANPTKPLSHNANVPDGGVSRVVEYGARSFTSDDVQRLAGIRAERLAVRQHLHRGMGAATRITTGTLFDLDQHPLGALNRSYLIVAATHRAWEPGALATWGDYLALPTGARPYWVELEALPSDVQYRHPSTTPWPRIDGFELAVVDGPATSQYAQIDEQGRYAVKFKFDEGSLKDGKASTWLRMMQPHGGSLEGWHFPLRKGTEVICSYLGGDVDRPIIQAIVPNPDMPSPVTSANQSQNVLHTGGGTYLTIEDRQGSEFVNLFTPKTQAGLYLGTPRGAGGRERTANSAPLIAPKGPGGLPLADYSFDLRTDEGHAQLHTGKNLDVHASGQLQLIAGADTNLTHFGALDKDVIGVADEKYAQKLKRRVGNKVTIRHDDTHDLRVLGTTTQSYHDVLDMCVADTADQTMITGWCEEITGSPGDLDFDANRTRTIVGPLSLKVEPGSHIHVGGDLKQTITGGRKETIKGKLTIEIGGTYEILQQREIQSKAAGEWQDGGNAFEFTTPFKFDNVTGVHNEKWIGAHVELTAALASATLLSTEIAASYSHIQRKGPGLSITGAEIKAFLVWIAIMKNGRCHKYGNMNELGLLSITTKGMKFI